MIGIGIAVATWLIRRRFKARRIHPDMAVDMLIWIIPAGIIGARAYHVITDARPMSEWLAIWKGGLGIPGGILLGALAALVFFKRYEIPAASAADAIAPAIPLAQAIGRWGNWWNQELYGRPTQLPWGLKIDNPVSPYEPGTLFHPTFLYESIWNVGLCFFLIWLDGKGLLKKGRLIWAYAGGYAIGRLWIEAIRIDHATQVGGLRINLWVMSLVLLISIAMVATGLAKREA